MAVRTKERDLGRNRILKEVAKLKRKPHVKIGFQGQKAQEEKKSFDASGVETTSHQFVSVVEIALVHEFGSPTKNIPERSFLRSTHDEKKRERFRISRKLLSDIMAGSKTVEQALDLMGLKGVTDARKKIQSSIPPALKPATIRSKTVRGKSGTTPLIDTGQMVQSINFEKVL